MLFRLCVSPASCMGEKTGYDTYIRAPVSCHDRLSANAPAARHGRASRYGDNPVQSRTPGQLGREPKREYRDCMAGLVDGIGKQGNATGRVDDNYLDERSDEQADK
jgi:hypothetical protein